MDINKKKNKFQIITHWNFPNYIPLNGFHNLYQSLFFYSKKIDFVTTSLVKLQKKDIYKNFYDSFFNNNEIEYLNKLFSENIFFHHTNLASVASKQKYIFHCESFLPIFMPFAFQGNAKLEHIIKAKKEIEEKLQSDNCLIIISHVKQTLLEIKKFFNNPKINKKLKFVKNSYPQNFYKKYEEIKKNDLSNFKQKHFLKNSDIIFFYGNSQSGSDGQFELRGGIITILSAIDLLKKFKNLKFIFASKIPSNEILIKYKLNTNLLKKYKNNFIWIDHYLEQKEIAILYKISNFFMLPSANLHSTSILQSIITKTLPVVLDTKGNEEFLDETCSIYIKNYKNKIWEEYIDNHENYKKNIFSIKKKIVNKIEHLLKNKSEYLKLLKKLYTKKKEFDPKTNSKMFEAQVLKILKKINYKKNNLKKIIKINQNPNFFNISPRPQLIFNYKGIKIFKFYNLFYLKFKDEVETGCGYWNLNQKKGQLSNIFNFDLIRDDFNISNNENLNMVNTQNIKLPLKFKNLNLTDSFFRIFTKFLKKILPYYIYIKIKLIYYKYLK